MPIVFIGSAGLLIWKIYNPPNTDIGETHKGVCAILTAVSAYFFVQMYQNYNSCKENTQKLISKIQTHTRLIEAYSKFIYFFTYAKEYSVKDYKFFIENSPKEYAQAIITVGNIFEEMGLQIKEGLVDDTYLYSFYGGILIDVVGEQLLTVKEYIKEDSIFDSYANAIDLYRCWKVRSIIDKFFKSHPFLQIFFKPLTDLSMPIIYFFTSLWWSFNKL